MPRKPIDYKKTVMYKIVSKDLDCKFIYVGSTTDFTKRKNSHKSSCTNEKSHCYNLKVYQTIRENGSWDKFQMIEIEKFPCKDHNESLARERYWLEHFNANMNIVKPCRTTKEYNKDNKEKISEQQRFYYTNNEDKIKEKHKKYYQQNKKKICESHTCGCGGKYSIKHKIRHTKTAKHQTWLQNSDSESSSDSESFFDSESSSDSDSSSDNE
jgi:hypothetical protein